MKTDEGRIALIRASANSGRALPGNRTVLFLLAQLDAALDENRRLRRAVRQAAEFLEAGGTQNTSAEALRIVLKEPK